jgi:hypothetical protein
MEKTELFIIQKQKDWKRSEKFSIDHIVWFFIEGGCTITAIESIC